MPPRYALSDGEWVEDYGWSLWGKGTAQLSATPAAARDQDEAGHASSRDEEEGAGDAPARYHTTLASAMADTSPSSTTTSPPLSPTPAASRSSSSSHAAAEMAAQPSESASAAAASATVSAARISIPDGWQAKSRETDYYAVPIIIAMSVLVAIIVVISIFVSVLMRRKKRRRSRRRHGGKAAALEAEGEKGWRGMVEKAMKPVRGARTKKGRKRAREDAAARPATTGDATGAPEGGSGGSARPHRRVRTTGYAAGPRTRPRRRRRREGDADDDDEATALTRTGTRSSTSSVAHDTLTARLSARMRGDRPSTASSTGAGGAGAATVFSRDVTSRSQVSLTASALSRVSSLASHRSSRSLAVPSTPATAAPPELLFTPADDPSLPDHLPIPGSSAPSTPSLLTRERSVSAPAPVVPPAVSSFGALVTTDALPALGPPAYRPSSSTVQTTRRYGAGDAAAPTPPSPVAAPSDRPRARRVFGRRRESRGVAAAEDDDAAEGEWHWPGEKGRPLAGEVAPIAGPSSPPPPPLVVPATAESADEADEPPVDRALFSAHIATDDKAVLARLRTQRDRAASDARLSVEDDPDAGPSSLAVDGPPPPLPSAPLVHDDDDDRDVDEDGFERFDAAGPSGSAPPAPHEDVPPARAWPAASTSFLPAPPQRVQQASFAYAIGGPGTPSASSPLLGPRSTTPAPAAAAPSKAALAAEYGAAEEDADVDALPRYLAGGGAGRETLGLASAPVAGDDDDEEEAEEQNGDRDELEYAEAGALHEVARNDGAREQEGVV